MYNSVGYSPYCPNCTNREHVKSSYCLIFVQLETLGSELLFGHKQDKVKSVEKYTWIYKKIYET